jgi:hypothetical protein
MKFIKCKKYVGFLFVEEDIYGGSLNWKYKLFK